MTTSSSGIDAKSTSHLLVDFDDGHRPGGTKVATKMAVKAFEFEMPLSTEPNKLFPSQIQVFDNLLSPLWCNRAYEFAIERQKPWGAYVQTKDLGLEMDDDAFGIEVQRIWDTGECERAISLMATRQLLLLRANLRDSPQLLDLIDGTAVWCLTSSENNSVEYHMDYAELYRYETNTIFPPVLAGTCQVSPVHGAEDMVGGDFRVNLRGLDHYKEWGYKAKLAMQKSSKQKGEEQQPQPQPQPQPGKYDKGKNFNPLGDDDVAYKEEEGWVTVPYKHNRGILHEGVFPHLSSRVSLLKPGIQRVILGFNSFTQELSECNIRAPEHSDAFNRTTKLYQMMAGLGMPITVGISVGADIDNNPPLPLNSYGDGDNCSNSNSSSGSGSGTSSSSGSSAAVPEAYTGERKKTVVNKTGGGITA